MSHIVSHGDSLVIHRRPRYHNKRARVLGPDEYLWDGSDRALRGRGVFERMRAGGHVESSANSPSASASSWMKSFPLYVLMLRWKLSRWRSEEEELKAGAPAGGGSMFRQFMSVDTRIHRQ